MYAKFDRWVLTYLKGLDGLSGMSREVRRRLKKRLRRRQEYMVRGTARRPAPVPLPPPVHLPPPPPPPVAVAAAAPAAVDPAMAADLAELEASLATLLQMANEFRQ